MIGSGCGCGRGWIWQQVQTQAAFLAYVDVFWTLALISASAIPLALLLRKVKLGGQVSTAMSPFSRI